MCTVSGLEKSPMSANRDEKVHHYLLNTGLLFDTEKHYLQFTALALKLKLQLALTLKLKRTLI